MRHVLFPAAIVQLFRQTPVACELRRDPAPVETVTIHPVPHYHDRVDLRDRDTRDVIPPYLKRRRRR